MFLHCIFAIAKSQFYQGFVWFFNEEEVRHRMLINIMILHRFMYLSVECASESSILHRFNKVLGHGGA